MVLWIIVGFAARTKICDPAFTNDTSRIDEISTKGFGKLIYPNITDVSLLSLYAHRLL